MQYQAELELSGKQLSDTEADQVLDELPGLHAVISHDRPHPEVLLTVPAESVVQATALAVGAVERATGRTVIVAQVMPTEVWDARQGFIPVPELIGATDAAALLGVSRQRIAQMVDEGKLPARRAGNTLVFARGTVEALADAHLAVTPSARASGEVIRSGTVAAMGAATPEGQTETGASTAGAAIP